MNILLKTFAIGAVLTMSAPVAFAQDVRLAVRPNLSSLPFMVLAAKAAEFLPAGMNVVMHPVPKKPDFMAAMKNSEVDYATLFNVAGAKLHSEGGMSHLQLAGIIAWGGPAILSRSDIAPGDWAAMKGGSMLVTPGIKTPPHKISAAAMMVNGVNPRQDVMMAPISVHDAFTQMASADNAPDFVIMAEPHLSMALLKMAKQGWPTQYHIFANSTRSVTPFGIALAGLWIVGEQENDKAFVAGYEKAVAYLMDPANRKEVAAIISAAFSEHFGKTPPPAVFSNMLERGVAHFDYKSASALHSRLRGQWAAAGLDPSRDIIWHGNDFKVPNQGFLVSQLMPRFVGVALLHGQDLGLSQKTRIAAIRIRKDAHEEMILQIQAMQKAEAEVFAAYLADDWDAVDTAFVKMSEIRLESARIQARCIQRAHAEYAPQDVKKIRAFMVENADLILEFGGL